MSDSPIRTVEARWFVRGPLPEAARAWFEALGPLPAAASRVDRYLAPTSDALGLKVREGRIEPKRREAALGPLRAGRAEAGLEAWTKWAFDLAAPAAPDDGWVEVRKTRRQRRLEAGGGSCALELSEVTAGGEPWWSVCLEAEGPGLEARRAALGVAAHRWLARDDAPALPAAVSMGYPAWLMGLDGA